MASWIETLKSEKDKEAEAQARLEDIRLHKARIIHGKAWGWFALLLERVMADCQEMLSTFPNETRYHPFVNTKTHGGFSLHGGGMPRTILRLDLQVNAQQINMCESLKQDFALDPFPQASAPIGITVGLQEELIFTFRGTPHDTPEGLSQQLIRYVCDRSGRRA
jgi:hypothetical protein